MKEKDTIRTKSNVILIGAGIMSATLGVLLKELNPHLTITVLERLDAAARESSNAWNNAGTGHSAFCELNYTVENEDGSIQTKKALQIAESYEISKEFWAYLAGIKQIIDPEDFIHSVPHFSFVWGDENVRFLEKRFNALKQYELFNGLIYTEDRETISEWLPLVMKGRDPDEKVAATRMDLGTDVNFGTLTRAMFRYLETFSDVHVHYFEDVKDLERSENGNWHLTSHNLQTHEKEHHEAKFVFIGAGGGSLPLLEKSDIPEASGFGGFPVSGQWLRCKNKNIIKEHFAKVYGKANVGSPPMSVPHLDTRIIEGKKELLFGPYAGFTTKFLKKGSYLDLVKSLEFDNIFPMLSAGMHNLPLTKYLISQALQSHEDRIEALKEYFPEVNSEDWELVVAGQRVQVIKKDEEEGGVLEFGTEVVSAKDGSLAALLGASPGASTSVSIMLEVLSDCFPNEMKSKDWRDKLKTMIPSFGESMKENPELCSFSRKRTEELLGLKTLVT
ncbi:malate:quinone oxidoreductase [Leptospira levettii]|uniref:Probable malate:quinone oxidoreductase n=1 Tax=Leptospira levettii TaxID=2023178 RepID=A0A5F2DBE4_9LEPT|nr:malate:quinone oxidoreductase [Leptospira levettii]MCW7464422.1 malate:quinone oxidoreductase [Leptospira levettii]MCW7511393.1 malate:quinone oxidoreductase [Leptospira levettii]MCW7515148.1 malate:quinone oxidoreductase [Leptospira levettii]TGM70179.1 malate:quinone oxidoreductase [Leptospira levettii]TGM77011.1 malate:quinone oxidoreductase [Leptospira levettii]